MSQLEKFFQIEANYSLSYLVYDDLWIYPLLKADIMAKINSDYRTNKVEKSFSLNILKLFGLLRLTIKSTRLKSFPFLYFGHAESRRFYNGSYIDVYFGEIENVLKEKILYIEQPNPVVDHKTPVTSNNIYYPDLLLKIVYLKSKIFRKRKIDLDFDLAIKIYNEFNIPVNQLYIEKLIRKFFSYVNYFERILKKTKPKVIISLSYYSLNKHALAYASKRNAIKSIELQHGFMSNTTVGYLYNTIENYSVFPDYMFAFGDFFKEILRNNPSMFKKENVFSTGFPFIEKIKNSDTLPSVTIMKKIQGKKVILFASQWHVSEICKQYLLEILKLLNKEYFILYKTHPNESVQKNFYDEVKNFDNVLLIDNPSETLHTLLKVSDIHATINSTTFFEAAYFGAPTIFLYEKESTYFIEEFINNQCFFLAKNAKEFMTILKNYESNCSFIKEKTNQIAQTYFKDNALVNNVMLIEEIANII